MNIEKNLGIGRLKGGRTFTLFLYPPPRGDYFVVYNEHFEEVHRFNAYFTINDVLRLTSDPAAPDLANIPLNEFDKIKEYLN